MIAHASDMPVTVSSDFIGLRSILRKTMRVGCEAGGRGEIFQNSPAVPGRRLRTIGPRQAAGSAARLTE